MRTTGSVHNIMSGYFYSSKGEYRLYGITSGIGGRFISYFINMGASRYLLLL